MSKLWVSDYLFEFKKVSTNHQILGTFLLIQTLGIYVSKFIYIHLHIHITKNNSQTHYACIKDLYQIFARLFFKSQN